MPFQSPSSNQSLSELSQAVQEPLKEYVQKRSGFYAPWTLNDSAEVELAVAWSEGSIWLLTLPFLLYKGSKPGLYRDSALTRKKVELAELILGEMRNLEAKLEDPDPEIAEDTAINFNVELRDLIDKLSEKNQALHKDFGKRHYSYKENYERGYSSLYSWWNTTTFQSNLAQAAEKCREILDHRTRNLQYRMRSY